MRAAIAIRQMLPESAVALVRPGESGKTCFGQHRQCSGTGGNGPRPHDRASCTGCPRPRWL